MLDQSSKIRFYRMIESAQLPKRPDRSAAGTLPTRATRYCDAVTTASAWGWYLYPLLDFELLWEGNLYWRYGQQGWMRLTAAQFPNFAREFDQRAPADLQGCAPPFLTAMPEPGAIQVWTGYFVRAAPNWSLAVKAPVNLPADADRIHYSGVIEPDLALLPLLVQIRLTRTGRPVEFRKAWPLVQAQPVHRSAYQDQGLDQPQIVSSLSEWEHADWEDYLRTAVRTKDIPPGRYAVQARRRRKSGVCPFHIPALSNPVAASQVPSERQ
jgi:Family of unknown function (DUF6065)